MITMIKIFKYLNKKQWMQILLSLVFIVTQVFLDLKIPDSMSKITMYVESPGYTVGDIIGEGKWMLMCAFASLYSSELYALITARPVKFSRKILLILSVRVCIILNFGITIIIKIATNAMITNTVTAVAIVHSNPLL